MMNVAREDFLRRALEGVCWREDDLLELGNLFDDFLIGHFHVEFLLTEAGGRLRLDSRKVRDLETVLRSEEPGYHFRLASGPAPVERYVGHLYDGRSILARTTAPGTNSAVPRQAGLGQQS